MHPACGNGSPTANLFREVQHDACIDVPTACATAVESGPFTAQRPLRQRRGREARAQKTPEHVADDERQPSRSQLEKAKLLLEDLPAERTQLSTPTQYRQHLAHLHAI